MVQLWSMLLFFNKMPSAILLAKILVLLMNVMRVEVLQKQGLQCNWVCDVTDSKEVGGTREQIGANFKFSQRVHPNCTGDTTVNSWDFIRVGIIVALDVGNPSEFSFSDFLTLGIEHVSPRQFLFGNENTDLEYINSNVSCLLQPKLNETGRVASNGLNGLYSPLFYLRNFVRNSQKTPYLGYVEIGGKFNLTAGFTNSMSAQYRLTFDQSDLTRVKIFSVLLMVFFLLRSPSLLTLFCPTIKTVQIERLPRATSVEEPEENPCSKTTHSPTKQEESVIVNLDSVRDFSSAQANLDARKLFKLREFHVARSSSTLRAFRYALNNLINNSSDRRSEMMGLRQHAEKVSAEKVIPTATVPEFSQTRSVGISGHGASRGSSTMEQSSDIVTIEPDTPQTVVQHPIKNGKLDSVQVMDVRAPASPVGLRSFIANKVFSNSKSLPYQFVKFFILIMFPPLIPILIDVFVLAIPRLFPRIASSLPSPFLIKSVFIFTYEVCPGFMYFCFFCYIIRIGCFCFLWSSSNWVPSFLGRKHLVCFIRNHYLSQLIYPSNSRSACDECKEAPDLPKHCEIPVNITCNDHSYSLIGIVKKDWKDVSQNFYPKYIRGLSLGSEDESSCPVLRKLVCLILSGLLFFFLVILDTVASLPIVSLCYGRVWFTGNCSQDRYTQAVCLIAEFFGTCFAVVGISYFLFCSTLSMVCALSSFYITALNYPLETGFYLVINIMNWHIMWNCYSSFTNIYGDLLLKLFNACSKDHESEFHQYKKGNVQYIPQKLFTSACDRIKPIGNSVKKLFFHLIIWVACLFLLLSFTMGSRTDISIGKILAGTVTIFVVVHPLLWDFLLTRGKEKERKDEMLKDEVKHHVDAFFQGKLD